MPKQGIQPEGLPKRVVGGRVLYSHVVKASGGTQVFISGQLARDAGGNLVGKGDMRAQIRQVCENLKAALAAVGATFDHVVKTTTYTTQIDEYFRCVEVRYEYFTGEDLPASTTVEVRRLSHPDFLVEVEAIAVLP